MDFEYLEQSIINLNDFAIFDRLTTILKYFSANNVEAPIPYLVRRYLFQELSTNYNDEISENIKLKFRNLSREGFALSYTLIVLRVYLITNSNIHHKSFKKHIPATFDLLLDFLNQKISTETLRININNLSELLGLSHKFTSRLTKYFFRNYLLIMKVLYEIDFSHENCCS